ncbi:unnamed protein product (macronuclear) [Paramecium tetraurelia]|uniref:Uncharacterized protein n=1 Tax=Paramecium tetraurelia TaxID=5888 RepID=A0CS88_PARTE|nr:uncharacterized protein GSPATT00009927001 [Paramecium tetraurelia]CAK73655.1 unnamed protein product [Paramecium tetraurelia]|eukprot:XP_001441052.1 hypothetical protein (macronuclear) [Paramecium tetraurelia strain d4-2]
MSKKKRVSWFFESQQEPKDEQNQSSLQINTVEEPKQDQRMPSQQITQPAQVVSQAPQPMPSSQFDLESNRTRKVSFIPFIGKVAESTPPKLSPISEEQPSSKKQEPQQNELPVAQSIQIQYSIQKQAPIQNQLIQTSQQLQQRTPKAIRMEENTGKQSYRKNVKPVEIDIVKDLQQLNSLAEMNDATLKRVITREEQEILQIQDVLYQRISKLQQKLIQLNDIEQKQLDSKMNNNNKVDQIQDREDLFENQLDEPKQQEQNKGSSQQIRAMLIQCLGYQVSSIYYDKKRYQITFTYKQANVQYTFQNQKQIDGNLEIQDIFNEFYRELQENRLVLSGLKIDYKQKTEINKGEIVQLSLKHQFQNSNKMANEIIFSAIHQMPILLSKVDELEQQLLVSNNIWGTLWRLDSEKGFIQILFSHRYRIDDKNLLLNSKKKVLRFEINLRTFEIQYQFYKYFDEIISPFIQKDSKRKQSAKEISVGERAEGLVSDEFTETIQEYLLRKPNLSHLVEWLNIIQLN